MRQGPTPRRVHELARLFGVDRATVARWQAFWRDYIPQTPFWKLARGRVVPVVEIVVLPLSLLEAFHRTKDPCQDWGYLLRFLSPLSVPSNPLIKMMRWSTIFVGSLAPSRRVRAAIGGSPPPRLLPENHAGTPNATGPEESSRQPLDSPSGVDYKHALIWRPQIEDTGR